MTKAVSTSDIFLLKQCCYGENTGTCDDVNNSDTISETVDDEKQPEPAVSKKRNHLVCKHCNEEVKSEWYLHPSRHDCKKKNENTEKDGYYCQHCKNPYSSKSNLRKHEASCPMIKAEGTRGMTPFPRHS